ncbi:MAG: flagellar protein FlgN [Planctomycetota bacterium]
MMENNLSKLSLVVEAEIRNYEQLRDLERLKRAELIAGRHQSLGEILAEEEGLASTLRNLEARRRALQDAWAASRGLKGQCTLGDIAGMVEGPEGIRLAGLRKRLKDLSLELNRENEGNSVLVRQSLEHLSGLFQIITGHHLNLAYEARGTNSHLGVRTLLDRSA